MKRIVLVIVLADAIVWMLAFHFASGTTVGRVTVGNVTTMAVNILVTAVFTIWTAILRRRAR